MLTGRIGLSPTMIGRTTALDRLRAVVEQAGTQCSDLPAVVLVVGEAGIGKTRLVREVLDDLPAEVQVCSVAAEPGSLARPHDVVHQLAPAGSTDPAGDAFARLARAAQEGAAVLVVEDLHWIDAESATFIDDVARQAWPSLVIIGTYRPSDLRRGAPGGDLVLRLERRNEVEQLRLDRLGRNEVSSMMAAIVGSAVSSAAVEAVARRSGGVPFVVEELMRCADADSCSSDIFDVQLPWSLEEAVRQQLAGLTPGERTLVDALAVFAQPAGFEVLAAITGVDEADLIVQLRGLVERGVVVEPREDRLWFGHALVADAVLHQLLGRERRRLHERCFDTLSRVAPDDFAGLAHHAYGAGHYDAIIGIARRGARVYLDRGASFQALRLACDGLAEDGDEVELLAVATEAAWRLDFLNEALDHAGRWLELAPNDSARIDAMRYIGRIHLELGDLAASAAMTEQLVAEVDRLTAAADVRLADVARAEGAIAQLIMLRHEPDAIDWADRAIEHARAAGDRPVEVQAMVERASTMLNRASRRESLAAMHEAAAGAEALGDGVLLSRALNNMMELLPPGAEESRLLRQQLRTTAAATGFDKLGAQNVVWWDALAAQAEGDLATFRRLLDVWASWGISSRKPLYQAELARLAAEEGRVDDARRGLQGLPAELAELKDYVVERLTMTVAALSHDVELGRVAFERLMTIDHLPDSWAAVEFVCEVVSCALAIDITPDEIRRRVYDEYLAGHPSRAMLVAASEGLVLHAEQRHAEAALALRACLANADDTMPRPLAGSLQVVLAQSLLALGDRAGALASTQAALDALARWPGWRRDRADALSARLGGSSVRPIGQLTARESEVAALIAEGLTNAQLADRLFISPKTAAVHVSNILAKLGLSTRAEIAAWEIRRQLPAAG